MTCLNLSFLVYEWKLYKDKKERCLAEKSHSRNIRWPKFKLLFTMVFYLFIFNDFPTLCTLFTVWSQTDHIRILTPRSTSRVASGIPFTLFSLSFVICER